VPISLFSLVVYRKIPSKEARNLLNFALSALSGLPVGGEFDLYLVLSRFLYCFYFKHSFNVVKCSTECFIALLNVVLALFKIEISINT